MICIILDNRQIKIQKSVDHLTKKINETETNQIFEINKCFALEILIR